MATKTFTPRPVRLAPEVIPMLPEALRRNLINVEILWAVKPDAGGDTFVSDQPVATGRVCTFVPTDKTEPIGKPGAKAPQVNVNLRRAVPEGERAGDDHGVIVTVAMPENVTAADLEGLIRNAVAYVDEQVNSGACPEQPGKGFFDLVVEHMNAYGPCAVEPLNTDLTVEI